MASNNNSSSIWYSFTKEELTRGRHPDEIKQETFQRRETCAFLQDAGVQMRLPQLTIATAIVFFHRFFARHSFRDYDPFIVAITCLFLAGKVEETPKKLREVLEVTTRLKNKNNPNYVLDSETLGLDLQVEHAYRHLLTYVKGINGDKRLAQVAWNFVNDSLRTTLCLQFKPQLIACAAIYLASKYLSYEIPVDKKPWWEVFDPTTKKETLEEISNQILDLYDSPNVNAILSCNNTGSSKQTASSPSSSKNPQPLPTKSSSSSDGKSASSQKPPSPPPSSTTPSTQPPSPRSQSISPSKLSHRSSDYHSGSSSHDQPRRESLPPPSRSSQRSSPYQSKRHHPYNA